MRALGSRLRGRRSQGDEGVSTIELLGVTPIVLLFAALGLQLGAWIWAVTSTNEAVRQGARAASLGDDGCDAARATVSDALDVVHCSSNSTSAAAQPNSIRMVVEPPMLGLLDMWLDEVDFTITREAHLP